jgi:hypothetical protein
MQKRMYNQVLVKNITYFSYRSHVFPQFLYIHIYSRHHDLDTDEEAAKRTANKAEC